MVDEQIDKDKLIRVLQAIGYISIKQGSNYLQGMFWSEPMRCLCIDVAAPTWYNTYEIKRLYLFNTVDTISLFKELEEWYKIPLHQDGDYFVSDEFCFEQFDINKKYKNGDVVQDLSGDYMMYVNEVWRKL